MLIHAVAFALVIGQSQDPRLAGAFRENRNGWVYAHLHGSPEQIGFQYGFLLADEIDDANKELKAELTFSGKDWAFYRQAAAKIYWRKVPNEYKGEITGMSEGLRAKGFHYDTTDILVQNSWIDLSEYYVPYLKDLETHGKAKSGAPCSCSAFVATGHMTKDGRPVMAHSCWLDYPTGERFNLILDIVPARGNHILMDSWPGFIHSGDDFGISSAGIMVTETTIACFKGFDPNGIPEFVRAREALQYSNNLGDFERIMTTGNNGGYANTWLVADNKTNEIGELELGLKNVTFKRSTDGFFVGANTPQSPDMIKQECDNTWPVAFCADRRTRWLQLMAENAGKIDDEAGKRFLADHSDIRGGKSQPESNTICGHMELDDRKDVLGFMQLHEAVGAVQGKVVTAKMAEKMSFWARMGHPCGEPFSADAYRKKYPWFPGFYKFLKDMPTRPWTVFESH